MKSIFLSDYARLSPHTPSASLKDVRTSRRLTLFTVTFAVALVGCSSSPEPGTAHAPPSTNAHASKLPETNLETGFTRIIAGAGDSVTSIPGSASAQYAYRFRQIDPASDRFTFQDRELSFYFRPRPSALHFQVENRQNRPVWIDWDRSTWVGVMGTEKIAHGTTRWSDRYGTQSSTQIVGLQRYSDYAFPISSLVDPGGSDQQLHRLLLPEDQSSIQYVNRVFGVDLVFRIDDRYVPYSFRFRIESAVPR